MKLQRIHPLAPWIAALVLLGLVPFFTTNLYQMYLLNIICINVLMGVGLNIVKGFAGQVTVGHIGLYAIGAYSSAILSLNFGFSFWLALPSSILITMFAGAIIGIPSFRLQGPYLALATLGFSESIRLYITVTMYFGATMGISSIPAPQIGEIALDSPITYYYLVLPITVAGIYFSFQLLNSSVGRAFKAIREDQLAAAASGINLRRYKLLAFVVSAIYAGFAGSLYAHLTPGYIHPNNFTLQEAVIYVLMIVLGGMGHIWGGIIGAIFITIVFDLTREYYQYQLIIFGLVMMGTILYFPKGIGGFIDKYLITRRFIQSRAKEIPHDAA
ncbi:MAG: branched-chain amino acid ABC transporter permease [bacterium]|nr:branched-chain amino acid ABC transporter permease [bacterium]